MPRRNRNPRKYIHPGPRGRHKGRTQKHAPLTPLRGLHPKRRI